MSNTNRYRDDNATRGDRGQPRGTNGDDNHWTPYNDDRHEGEPRDWSDDRFAHGRWEDTRMGMGSNYRGNGRGDDRQRGWEASDFRVPSQPPHASERDAREQWRARDEASRAERTNRGNDDGPRYAPDDRYRDERQHGERHHGERQQVERHRGERHHDDRARDEQHRYEAQRRAHEDARWSDDHYRGWRDEHDEPRHWRPEPQRAMQDRNEQGMRGDWRRDDPRMQGDWRREHHDWRPGREMGRSGEYRTGADDRWREHATQRNERDWRGGERDWRREDMRGYQSRDDNRGDYDRGDYNRGDYNRGDYDRGDDQRSNTWRGNETRGSNEDYRRGSYGRDNPDARYSMEQRDWRARPERDSRDMNRGDMNRGDANRSSRRPRH